MIAQRLQSLGSGALNEASCLLARVALEDLPPGPLSAFCVSNDTEVQARFRARFEDLGYVYPGARYAFGAAADRSVTATRE